jgi:AraC-like DNA-binding protein
MRLDANDQTGERRVGEGPLVRNGFADLIGIDGGLAVGLTRMSREAPLSWLPMEIGADHHVVFNYVTEKVDFEGTGPTMLTPNELVVCPAGSVYRRRQMLSGEEVNVFVAASPDFAEELGCAESIEKTAPKLVPALGRLSSEAWCLAHELRNAPAERRIDLEYTERAALLITPLRSTAAAVGELRSTSRTRRRHHELVEATREHLASSFADQTLSLAQLARDVGAGAYHLARIFRTLTGYSLHEYRTQLRLRAILLELADSESLSELALSAGFSSHSHFSDVFRRHFDASPSQVRAALRGQPHTSPGRPRRGHRGPASPLGDRPQ